MESLPVTLVFSKQGSICLPVNVADYCFLYSHPDSYFHYSGGKQMMAKVFA